MKFISKIKSNSFILLLIAFLSCGLLCGCSIKYNSPETYVVLNGEDADFIDDFPVVDLLVIDGEYYEKEDVEILKSRGIKKIYSYLNIGSLETFRDYYDDYDEYTLGDYENWPEEKWVDVSSKAWQSLIKKRVQEISEKGFDGFFVDNVDVYYLYPKESIYKGISNALRNMHDQNMGVIINGGDTFVLRYLESGKEHIFDAVNQEDVYTNYDFDNDQYGVNTKEDREYFEEYLDQVIEAGYKVYTIEYADKASVIRDVEKYSRVRGYVCYVSDNIQLRLNKHYDFETEASRK